MNPLMRMLIAVAVGFVALCAPSETPYSIDQLGAQAMATNKVLYLPVVSGEPSPAGTYDCLEYEFGLIWTTEVITLSIDGSSIYAYSPPSAAVVTGTWVYTPTAQELGFTNFRWITATLQLPNHLRASRYVSGPGFDVALSCDRRGTALN